MELIIYEANVLIKLYLNQIYLNKECHLNNASDPNVLLLNLIIYFGFDD